MRDAGDAGRLRHQELQVTQQKIHALFGFAVPAKISDTIVGIQVVFGISQQTVTVTMDRSPPSLIGSLDRRLIDGVMRRFAISNLEAMDAMRELATWIANTWDELDLREAPR